MTQRITLINHIDDTKSCLYGIHPVHGNISQVSYPEISEEEFKELYDIDTTPQRVQVILNSLTNT